MAGRIQGITVEPAERKIQSSLLRDKLLAISFTVTRL